jgi:hypothetical protein
MTPRRLVGVWWAEGRLSQEVLPCSYWLHTFFLLPSELGLKEDI